MELILHPDMEADLLYLPRNKKGNKVRKRMAAIKEVRVPYVSKARRAAIEESIRECMRNPEMGVIYGMTFHTSPYKEPPLWKTNKELLRFNKRKKQRRQRTGRR